MKINSLYFLFFTLLLPTFNILCAQEHQPNNGQVEAHSSEDNQPESSQKTKYTFKSFVSDAKDALMAYGILFGLTTIHELGHAIAAHLLLNKPPIAVVIGGRNPNNLIAEIPLAKTMAIGLTGLNPALGRTVYPTLSNVSPLRYATIHLAGPIVGAISSYFVWKKLEKTNYKLPKLVTIYSLFINTINPDLWLTQNYDGAKAISRIKEYFKTK